MDSGTFSGGEILGFAIFFWIVFTLTGIGSIVFGSDDEAPEAGWTGWLSGFSLSMAIWLTWTLCKFFTF